LLAAAFTTGLTGAATASSSLGAVYTPQATTFSIWSPDTDDVKLSLQGEAQLLPMARLPDTDEYTDVYSITVPGDHHLKRYNYRVNGQTVRDPYGVMVEPASNNNIVVRDGPSSLSWWTTMSRATLNLGANSKRGAVLGRVAALDSSSGSPTSSKIPRRTDMRSVIGTVDLQLPARFKGGRT